MSVWKDIRQKSLGKEKRIEDAERDRFVKNQLENASIKISQKRTHKSNYVVAGSEGARIFNDYCSARIFNEYYSNDSFSSIEDNYKI